MSRIRERKKQYLKPDAGHGTISHDLVESAQQALVTALRDRHKPVVRFAQNHYSPNAPAALLLAVIALDVSMNEAVAMMNVFGKGTEKRIALEPTCTKFQSLTGTAR